MKTCFKCNRRLEPEEFYRHPMMGDGRLGKCKDCTKRDVRARYWLKHEERLEYDRRRSRTARRRKALDLYIERNPEKAERLEFGQIIALCRYCDSYAALQFMWIWNDFITPNVFLVSPEKSTLVLQVYKSVGEFTTDWPSFMTLSVLALLPMVVFFVFTQRHIVSGLLAGGVKG